jgi:hypothetical protein
LRLSALHQVTRLEAHEGDRVISSATANISQQVANGFATRAVIALVVVPFADADMHFPGAWVDE